MAFLLAKMQATLTLVIPVLAPWVAWLQYHNCDGTVNIKLHLNERNLQHSHWQKCQQHRL
jgi:hypothetical protein